MKSLEEQIKFIDTILLPIYNINNIQDYNTTLFVDKIDVSTDLKKKLPVSQITQKINKNELITSNGICIFKHKNDQEKKENDQLDQIISTKMKNNYDLDIFKIESKNSMDAIKCLVEKEKNNEKCDCDYYNKTDSINMNTYYSKEIIISYDNKKIKRYVHTVSYNFLLDCDIFSLVDFLFEKEIQGSDLEKNYYSNNREHHEKFNFNHELQYNFPKRNLVQILGQVFPNSGVGNLSLNSSSRVFGILSKLGSCFDISLTTDTLENPFIGLKIKFEAFLLKNNIRKHVMDNWEKTFILENDLKNIIDSQKK